MGEEAVGENHQTYYLAPNTKWFRSSALIVHQFCFTSRLVGKRDVSRQSAPKVSIENDETLVGIEQTLQQTYFRGSARCVQSFDDSLDFAIRMMYRISLRSSSLWEPRHPLLKVVWHFALCVIQVHEHTQPEEGWGSDPFLTNEFNWSIILSLQFSVKRMTR